MKRTLLSLLFLGCMPFLFGGCSAYGSRDGNLTVLYIICALLSLLLLAAYCRYVQKKDGWMILLFSAVMIINAGYLALSVSSTIEEALLANLMRAPSNYRKFSDKLSADIFPSEFGKAVYEALLPYLERGEMPEYGQVIESLDGEQAAVLSRIINTKINTGNTAAECSDCIDKLIEEKAKSDVADPSALSDEEFKKLFNS